MNPQQFLMLVLFVWTQSHLISVAHLLKYLSCITNSDTEALKQLPFNEEEMAILEDYLNQYINEIIFWLNALQDLTSIIKEVGGQTYPGVYPCYPCIYGYGHNVNTHTGKAHSTQEFAVLMCKLR